MKTLGNKINEFRKQFNLTQDELAEKMDVSPQAVSKWENDISMPDVNVLVKLADLFDVSLDYLLRDKETPKAEQPQEEKQEKTTPKKDISKMVLYIKVYEPHGDNIKLQFPLALMKGNAIKKLLGKYVPEYYDIDADRLIEMIENGTLEEVLKITEADGTMVKIFIE